MTVDELDPAVISAAKRMGVLTRQPWQDMLGDAWELVERCRKTFDPEKGKLIAYVNRAVPNWNVDRLRRIYARPARHVPVEAGPHPASGELTPLEDALRREDVSIANRAIVDDTVDVVARGNTYAAAALCLGVPIGTVKSKVSRYRYRPLELREPGS